jgi:hypothetical protein
MCVAWIHVSVQCPVAGSYECKNKLPGSMQGGTFLEKIGDYYILSVDSTPGS